MLPEICTRPEVGTPHRPRQHAEPRTASSRCKPDLIVDVGVDRCDLFVALAEPAEEETGIPYALLDGRLLSLSTSYEKLGRLIGREGDGADLPTTAT